MSEADNLLDRQLAQWRKDNFGFKIGPAKSRGEIGISMTTGGNDWQTVSLLPEEWRQVHTALGECLDRAEAAKGETPC